MGFKKRRLRTEQVPRCRIKTKRGGTSKSGKQTCSAKGKQKCTFQISDNHKRGSRSALKIEAAGAGGMGGGASCGAIRGDLMMRGGGGGGGSLYNFEHTTSHATLRQTERNYG